MHSLLIGSSETTREPPSHITNKTNKTTCFQFQDYRDNYLGQHKNKSSFNAAFFEWFIGFAEGDGTFCYREENKKIRFLFQVGQKEPKILFKVKKILGFGRISFFKRNEKLYWRFSVEDKDGILRIISIFNGNFVLPKRSRQFEKWLSEWNRVTKTRKCFNSRIVSVSLKTGWLSGFMEAESCFYANFTNPSQRSKLSKRLCQKIQITQKNICDKF